MAKKAALYLTVSTGEAARHLPPVCDAIGV